MPTSNERKMLSSNEALKELKGQAVKEKIVKHYNINVRFFTLSKMKLDVLAT